ncbi:hypothetical protein JCGZ_06828 [Jatropha curcas]|uniref:Cytochrome P450 n=1 Tax=Jatropha curcas TaxID=180498 RepID=A0A067KZU1_JATCU|nr:hypothetical protein JCGZ_06828 [Jatropha curcas]
MPHEALYMLSTRYGPLIHLFLGFVPCVVASSPEMAKEFLKTHEYCFLDRQKMAAVDYLTCGSGFAFAAYGPYWKFMKKICLKELLGGRMLDQLLPVIRHFLKLMLKKANSVHLFIKSFNPPTQIHAPTSPPAIPLIGHLHLIGSGLPKSFQELAGRYGPLMEIRLGASTCVVASNATVAKEIFKTHDLTSLLDLNLALLNISFTEVQDSSLPNMAIIGDS